jgi:hypothetical protein
MSNRRKGQRVSRTDKSPKQQSLSIEELLLQPWFLSRRAAWSIQQLVPFDYRKRMADYFTDYGCMRCERTDVPHQSNGMCRECKTRIYTRLVMSAKRRMSRRLPPCYGKEFVARVDNARRLLRGLYRYVKKPAKPARLRSVQLGSPVIDALDRF